MIGPVDSHGGIPPRWSRGRVLVLVYGIQPAAFVILMAALGPWSASAWSYTRLVDRDSALLAAGAAVAALPAARVAYRARRRDRRAMAALRAVEQRKESLAWTVPPQRCDARSGHEYLALRAQRHWDRRGDLVTAQGRLLAGAVWCVHLGGMKGFDLSIVLLAGLVSAAVLLTGPAALLHAATETTGSLHADSIRWAATTVPMDHLPSYALCGPGASQLLARHSIDPGSLHAQTACALAHDNPEMPLDRLLELTRAALQPPADSSTAP